MNLSQKGVYRALKIASITPDVRMAIALLPIADNQIELLALADEDAMGRGILRLGKGMIFVNSVICALQIRRIPYALTGANRIDRGIGGSCATCCENSLVVY